jgi:arginine decarboxylase
MSTASVVVAIVGAGAAPDVERFLDALHALPDIGHWESGPVSLPAPGPRAMSIRAT